MNDYIINPMWFYLVSLAYNIRALCVCFIVVLSIVAAIYGAFIVECDFEDDEKKYIKTLKRCVIGLLVSAIVFVVLPSRETMYQMLIAKYATYGNAQSLLDAIKNGTDYIVESLKALK